MQAASNSIILDVSQVQFSMSRISSRDGEVGEKNFLRENQLWLQRQNFLVYLKVLVILSKNITYFIENKALNFKLF